MISQADFISSMALKFDCFERDFTEDETSMMKYFALCFLAVAPSVSALADDSNTSGALNVPHVFGDHMVLQEGQPVPVWGWAQPGEAITVTFAGQKKTATAGSDGAWKATLDPLAVSAQPADLTIAGPGTESLAFHDVLVGEVWLCSGQSNMQKPVGTWRGQPATVLNGAQEIAAANYPLIRLMNIEIANTDKPERDFNITPRGKPDYPWEGWVVCTPQSLDEIKFSAVGYFFAQKLFTVLNVPVGMIEATAGGTNIEGWMSANSFTDPALADFAKAAQTPKARFDGTVTTALYNGMIAPMVPYALKGILWYQGESNLIKNDTLYAPKIKGLITGWRANWGRELPFYYVQLPDLYYSKRKNPGHNPVDEAFFREQQDTALTLPKTGVAVTDDVGDLKNMHPPNKKPVGERLALWALADVYGKKDIEPSGPMYRPGSIEHEGPKAVLHFTHVGQGLESKDGQPLTWFTTAGADGVFYPAVAEISGDAVVITSPQVASPQDVRFGWDEAAMPNFYNKDGLPAVPFRTDHQPQPPEPAAAPVAGPAPTPDAAPQ
jgi:sialate O-acetylesterase